MKRAVFCRWGVITALVVTSGLATSTEASAASLAPGAILDWNASGNILGNGNNTWLTSNVVVELNNRNPQPTMLTFQEVCKTQVDDLYLNDLINRGFGSPAFYPAKSTGVCQGIGQFGNAVFIYGGGIQNIKQFYDQEPGATEKRGFACLASFYDTSVSVCSLHAVDSNLPIADCQALEAFTS